MISRDRLCRAARGRRAAVDPPSQTVVGYIRRGGEHLVNLVDDILDISRIESSRFSLSRRPVPLREVARRSSVRWPVPTPPNETSLSSWRPYRATCSCWPAPPPFHRGAAQLAHQCDQVQRRARSGGTAGRRRGRRRCSSTCGTPGPVSRPETWARRSEPFERLDADAASVAGAGARPDAPAPLGRRDARKPCGHERRKH